ncbi:hypothetical protein [Endozoicomonas sp.]|uniref:hypothetical protein n=1 Tax=Endozoicomonas sp. TaxID=1892382 RepID=UPI002885F2DD|nr:hypothetical protein [Endozoicomonas sp.]
MCLLPMERADFDKVRLQAFTLFNSTFCRCLRILIPIYHPAMIKRSLRDNPVTHDRQNNLSDTGGRWDCRAVGCAGGKQP